MKGALLFQDHSAMFPLRWCITTVKCCVAGTCENRHQVNNEDECSECVPFEFLGNEKVPERRGLQQLGTLSRQHLSLTRFS